MASQIIQYKNEHVGRWYLYSRWQKKVIETRPESKGPWAHIPISKNDD